jgi:hypothetical protein
MSDGARASMGLGSERHYFIERNEAGKYATRAMGSGRATALFDTQDEAIAHAKQLNPTANPYIESIRHTKDAHSKE